MKALENILNTGMYSYTVETFIAKHTVSSLEIKTVRTQITQHLPSRHSEPMH